MEKLDTLILKDNKRLVKVPECIEEMKSLTRLDVVDVIWIVYMKEWGDWRSCLI